MRDICHHDESNYRGLLQILRIFRIAKVWQPLTCVLSLDARMRTKLRPISNDTFDSAGDVHLRYLPMRRDRHHRKVWSLNVKSIDHSGLVRRSIFCIHIQSFKIICFEHYFLNPYVVRNLYNRSKPKHLATGNAWWIYDIGSAMPLC